MSKDGDGIVIKRNEPDPGAADDTINFPFDWDVGFAWTQRMDLIVQHAFGFDWSQAPATLMQRAPIGIEFSNKTSGDTRPPHDVGIAFSNATSGTYKPPSPMGFEFTPLPADLVHKSGATGTDDTEGNNTWSNESNAEGLRNDVDASFSGSLTNPKWGLLALSYASFPNKTSLNITNVELVFYTVCTSNTVELDAISIGYRFAGGPITYIWKRNHDYNDTAPGGGFVANITESIGNDWAVLDTLEAVIHVQTFTGSTTTYGVDAVELCVEANEAADVLKTYTHRYHTYHCASGVLGHSARNEFQDRQVWGGNNSLGFNSDSFHGFDLTKTTGIKNSGPKIIYYSDVSGHKSGAISTGYQIDSTLKWWDFDGDATAPNEIKTFTNTPNINAPTNAPQFYEWTNAGISASSIEGKFLTTWLGDDNAATVQSGFTTNTTYPGGEHTYYLVNGKSASVLEYQIEGTSGQTVTIREQMTYMDIGVVDASSPTQQYQYHREYANSQATTTASSDVYIYTMYDFTKYAGIDSDPSDKSITVYLSGNDIFGSGTTTASVRYNISATKDWASNNLTWNTRPATTIFDSYVFSTNPSASIHEFKGGTFFDFDDVKGKYLTIAYRVNRAVNTWILPSNDMTGASQHKSGWPVLEYYVQAPIDEYGAAWDAQREEATDSARCDASAPTTTNPGDMTINEPLDYWYYQFDLTAYTQSDFHIGYPDVKLRISVKRFAGSTNSKIGFQAYIHTTPGDFDENTATFNSVEALTPSVRGAKPVGFFHTEIGPSDATNFQAFEIHLPFLKTNEIFGKHLVLIMQGDYDTPSNNIEVSQTGTRHITEEAPALLFRTKR